MRLVILTLLSAAILPYSTPDVFSSDELISNGGFETGDLSGWNVTPTCDVRSYVYLRPHMGKYSLRLGVEGGEGVLSQTIRIPERSKANFSFAYKLDEGAALDVYLRDASGSDVQHWSLREETDWKLLKFEVDAQLIGKPLTIIFVGKVFTEKRLEAVEVTSPTGQTSIIYTWSIYNYWPYIDSVSVIFEKAYYIVNVEVSGLPAGLSTNLYVDDQVEGSVKVGLSKRLQFRIGEHHRVRVEFYVNDTQQVRYVCKYYSTVTNASSDETLRFDYLPQYLLTVESPYGRTEGSGWFNKDDTAKFSVAPDAIPMDGLPGFLGAKYKFKGWGGDLRSTLRSSEIRMDSPKKVVALWEADYSSAYVMGVVIAALVSIPCIVILKVVLTLKRLRKRR
ncbi:MAG: hypothetical protein QXH17_07450 [Candidatus Bathyarchaeia archaeon]